VLETRHESTRLEYQSITATKYTKPCAMGTKVISVDQT
jgi:hypothetical protein